MRLSPLTLTSLGILRATGGCGSARVGLGCGAAVQAASARETKSDRMLSLPREVRRRHRDGSAVGAWLAGAELYAALRVEQNRLPIAELVRAWRLHLEHVAHGGKLRAHLRRHRRFDLHVAALEGFLVESPRLERLLDVHAEIDDVGHELRVRLRLVPAALDAEADISFALLQEAGNDVVQRSLAPFQRVGQAGFQGEEGPAVVQHESRSRGHEARSKAVVVALDERDDVSVAVDHAQVDGVLALRGGNARELRRLHLAVLL